MKLLFNYNGKPDQKPYQHSLLVTFPNMKNGITLHGTKYKTIDDWVNAVRKLLLAMGISDFQCSYPPKKNDKDPFSINFLFKYELDQLQFWAVVFGDKKGSFNRTISSQTSQVSELRLKNVQFFLDANDIRHQIIVKDDFSFKVVTYSRFDYLAVASHFANESFDKGIENIPSPKSPRLLLKN
jgi:hypothetical protein